MITKIKGTVFVLVIKVITSEHLIVFEWLMKWIRREYTEQQQKGLVNFISKQVKHDQVKKAEDTLEVTLRELEIEANKTIMTLRNDSALIGSSDSLLNSDKMKAKLYRRRRSDKRPPLPTSRHEAMGG